MLVDVILLIAGIKDITCFNFVISALAHCLCYHTVKIDFFKICHVFDSMSIEPFRNHDSVVKNKLK